MVYAVYQLFAGRNQDFFAGRSGDLKQHIHRGVVHSLDAAHFSMRGIHDRESGKITPGIIPLTRLPGQRLGKEHLHADHPAGLLLRVDAFKLHQSRGIAAETVLLHEERHHDAVHPADQILRLRTVEHIIRERKVQLPRHSVRLGQHTYLIYLVFANHSSIRLTHAPKAARRVSMFS